MITVLNQRSITWDQLYNAGAIQSPTLSGVGVNELTALGIPALWCGLRAISEAVGSLPLITYRKTDQGRDRAEDHPLYALLHDAPNPEMTAPVFKEALMFCALLYGNAYAEVERDGGGRPVNLWPMHPNAVKVQREGRRLRYLVRDDQGEISLNPEDVLHVPGLQDGTGVGYSLLQVARETLGYSIAVSRFGSAWFGNAARMSGALSTPGQLSDVARENLRRSWQQLHSGPENAGSVAVLEEGLTWQSFQATNDQSQFMEVTTFLVGEVARLLNISPAKLQDLAGTSQYGTLETLATDFVQTTLRPWLVKFEAEYNRKLLALEERGTIYVEHLVDSLLRADTTSRFQTYAVAIQNKWMTVDEVRQRENLPPLPPEPEAAPEPEPVTPAPDVTALMAVADKVASKAYPPEAAKLMLQVSFPDADPAALDALVKAVTPPEEPAPAPEVPAPGAEPAPGAAPAPDPTQENNGNPPDQQPV